MACGTSVVATQFDGLADIVTAPAAGCIVMEATPTGLAAAIRERLAAPPAREATRGYAESFDWQATTSGQIELFRQICRGSKIHVPERAPLKPRSAHSHGIALVVEPAQR